MAKTKTKDIPKNGYAANGTKPLIGVAYSKENDLKTIRFSDTKLHGSDTDRIRSARDPRIKNRIYLKLKSGEEMPSSAVGEGEYAYIAEINGIYNEHTATEEQKNDLQAEIQEHESEPIYYNKIESALLSRGYTGYLSGDIIIVLDMNIKVKRYSEEHDEQKLELPKAEVKQTKKKLPEAKTKHKLSKKEASALSAVLPALQSKAPSITIKNNVLSVNDAEYQEFIKEASTFPNMPKFVTDAAQPQEDTSDISTSKAGRFARQRNKKTQDKKLVDTIQKVLLDDKFVKSFAGKISSTFETFQKESRTHNENQQLDHVRKQEEAIQEDESNDLLKQIRDILEKLSDATIADDNVAKETARESLEKILETTKDSSEEEQKYITDAINTVLSEMKEEQTKDDLGIRTKEPFSIPQPEQSKITETIATGEPTKKEEEDWDTPLKDIGAKRKTASKIEPEQKTPVQEQIEHMKKTGETVSKPTTSQKRTPVEIKEKPKARDIKRIARESIDVASGRTTFTPSFEPMPKNLSMGDTLLGAIVNSNKDIVTKDSEGREISRKASANKIDYTKKLARMGDEYLGEGGTMKALRFLKGRPKKEPNTNKPEFSERKKKAEYKKIEPTLEPTKPVENVDAKPVEDTSSTIADLVDIATDVPSKGGLAKRAGSFLGKAGKFIGKAAAPLAAGAAVVGGIGDIAEGKTVSEAADIIPEGGLLNKLNPFNYVMNAGRYVGDKWNKGYEAVSKTVGGSGALGSDIYDMFHKSPEMTSSTLKPKFDSNDLKPDTNEIAEAGMERSLKADTKAEAASPQNIVSNVTNNSNPVQQIMPSNMMTQRNTENAFQSMNNRKFSM